MGTHCVEGTGGKRRLEKGPSVGGEVSIVGRGEGSEGGGGRRGRRIWHGWVPEMCFGPASIGENSEQKVNAA